MLVAWVGKVKPTLRRTNRFIINYFTWFFIVLIIVFTVYTRTLFLMHFYSVDILLFSFLCWTFHMFGMDHRSQWLCRLFGQNQHLWLSLQSVPLVTSSRFNPHHWLSVQTVLVQQAENRRKGQHFSISTMLTVSLEPAVVQKYLCQISFNTEPLGNVDRQGYKLLSVAIEPKSAIIKRKPASNNHAHWRRFGPAFLLKDTLTHKMNRAENLIESPRSAARVTSPPESLPSLQNHWEFELTKTL